MGIKIVKELIIGKNISESGSAGSYVPQLSTLPEASASNVNMIVQYKGATTSDYTNGYFYKCNGGIVYSASVAFTDNKITASDANYLSFLQDAFPTKFMNIVRGEMIYHEAAMLWSYVGYDADGNNITRHWNGAAWIEYQLYTDDWEELGFSFNYEAQDLDEVAFTNTITIVSESYSWGRINVQPLDLTQVTGYDATKLQALEHDTTGIKWVDKQ